jgi:hypothetical protein
LDKLKEELCKKVDISFAESERVKKEFFKNEYNVRDFIQNFTKTRKHYHIQNMFKTKLLANEYAFK